MSRHVCFKPTKQRLSNKPLVGFDVETTGRKNDYYMASLVLDKKAFSYYEKQDILNCLKKKRFWGTTTCATNLQFDFDECFFNTSESMQFNLVWRGSDMLMAKTYNTKEGFSRQRGTSHHNKSLTFIDTLNYAKLSVKQLGKLIGIEKFNHPSCLGRLPESSVEETELLEYNLQDCRVSRQGINYLYDAFANLGASHRPTIASTAMSLYKNKHLKNVYWRHSIDDLLDEFKAYYGGRTEAFSRGNIKNYNYYDFNSLYPSVMLNDFPDPNTLRTTYKNTNLYIESFEGVSDVSITCPYMQYPLLPYKHAHKLFFPIGNWRAWYSHLELREALKLGYVITRVHKTMYFKDVCRPFDSYVLELYGARKDYENEGNEVMAYACKILLNSLYGKFGQRFTDKDEYQPFNMTKEELDSYDFVERFGDYIRVKQNLQEPSSFCIPIWALYVTAYARLKMHDYITRCNPVYVDTDSLITKKEFISNKRLGGLKLEMPIKEGIIVRPKFYCFVGRENAFVKAKGVGVRMTVDAFKALVNNENYKSGNQDDKKYLIENGIVYYDKFVKFREALRRNFKPNEIISTHKELMKEDDKRSWDKEYDGGLQDSKPAVMERGLLLREEDELILFS